MFWFLQSFNFLKSLTLSHLDADTSAPAWPNLSSACVSGRGYITEPPVMQTRPQDDTQVEGGSPWQPVDLFFFFFVLFFSMEKIWNHFRKI